MNDFLRSNASRRAQQRAIDGILNAPSRSSHPEARTHSARPLGRRPVGEGLRGSDRRLDNFRRPDGYHLATRSTNLVTSTAAPSLPRADSKKDSSLLQSTLPQSKRFGRRHNKAKQKGLRKARPLRKWLLRGGLATLCLILIIGGALFIKGYLKLHKVFKGGSSAAALHTNVSPTLLKGEGDGRINILLLGRGGAGHDGPDLTDTLLLASVDPINKTAALASVPRDMWVTTSSNGSSKINAVFALSLIHI